MTSDEGHEEGELITILLVEPNPGDTRLFTESFKDAELKNRLYTVADADAAIDFLNQRGEFSDEPRPDLLLLEPKLPGDKGTDVLAELNNTPSLQGTPVIVLTSTASGENYAKKHGLDADHYVQKPVEPEDFLEFVQEIEDLWLGIFQEQSTET